MRRRLAVCVGINDYPGSGSDLAGCLNDAYDWRQVLLDRGYKVLTILDHEATKAHILQGIRQYLAELRAGDRFVFTFSGHGTWVPDQDGDEADHRDEALCCFDYMSGGLLTDDEMHSIFQERQPGSRVTVLSDSCHSGTVSRFVHNPQAPKPKFISPASFSDISEETAARMEATVRVEKPRSASVLISGCADNEYSYDASFAGRPNGAFTYYALAALQEATTVKEVYDKLRTTLPSPQYPQTPQLEARPFQQRSSLL